MQMGQGTGACSLESVLPMAAGNANRPIAAKKRMASGDPDHSILVCEPMTAASASSLAHRSTLDFIHSAQWMTFRCRLWQPAIRHLVVSPDKADQLALNLDPVGSENACLVGRVRSLQRDRRAFPAKPL